MSQKRPYEAVTGRQGLPGSGGQAATEFESAPEGPKAKVPRATSEHQWVRSGYGERCSKAGYLTLFCNFVWPWGCLAKLDREGYYLRRRVEFRTCWCISML